MLECGRFDPTSKRHYGCGYLYQELTLDQREWLCQECGAMVERDENAALHIFYYALIRYFSNYSGVERTGVSVELSGKSGSEEAEKLRERASPALGSHLL